MSRCEHITQIKTSDFDAFASEVAAAIWNQLIDKPGFHTLKVNDYVSVFEAVCNSLSAYDPDHRKQLP